jgi:DNA polymerase V
MYRLRVRDHSTRPFHRYKKAGVTFLDPLLLDQPDDEPSLRRMRAIDQVNARFSRGTIGFGTAGECQAWSLRREFTSPRFTTDRNELLRV